MSAFLSSALKITLAWCSSQAGMDLIQQLVAWLLNWALKRYMVDRDRGDDLELYAKVAEHVAEASGVFSRAIADGEISTPDAEECRAAIMKILSAWANREPTPAEFKQEIGE